ncbi:MAG: PAS domain-containing protein, partial [bacterium]
MKTEKNRDQPVDAAKLRHHAEERLKRQRPEGRGRRTELEPARLIHELQVHQIELEMQNEELQRTRAQVEALLAQYTDLYDFAPVGYFTLDRDGTIRQVNLTGARLLGVERSGLVNRRFGLFVSADSRPAFNAFLKKVFESQAKETCEL